jgi:hypothetical protein
MSSAAAFIQRLAKRRVRLAPMHGYAYFAPTTTQLVRRVKGPEIPTFGSIDVRFDPLSRA